LWNFLAELIAPWFVFWPRVARHIAGSIVVLFLLSIAVSGNLSFLNVLTIIPAFACFDDSFWSHLSPNFLKALVRKADQNQRKSKGVQAAAIGLTCLVAWLSWKPVVNLFSPHQMMNTSFDPLDLVNTYGAFGTIGRERFNVVFQGTDSDSTYGAVEWKDYLYQALPVDVHEMPVQVAPYQPHLDWQMWFAAMGSYNQYPWTLHLVWKLLHNDPVALSFFRSNPFPDHPPRYIRAVLYKYTFAPPGNTDGAWWTREFQDNWLPPLSADNPQWDSILNSFGWDDNKSAQKTE
jgi:Lipase maturation factor